MLRRRLHDLAAIPTCALVWGTSWYVITLQLGTVDPIVSLVYRFMLAAAVLVLWCALRHESIALSFEQHKAAAGVGIFTFAIDYAFTYLAEARVVSAVVAVMFAGLAFVNLVVFRLAFGQVAPRAAWAAAALGAVGVVVLSGGEIVQAELDTRSLTGIAMALTAVVAAAVGNVFARRGEEAAAPLKASVAWSMGYGAALLALVAGVTRRSWTFDPSPRYALSLLYLALAASVLTFVLYYGLARKRGYTLASYILALTPVLAIAMSTVFEGKRWTVITLTGMALVLVGQWILLRVRTSDGVRRRVPSAGQPAS